MKQIRSNRREVGSILPTKTIFYQAEELQICTSGEALSRNASVSDSRITNANETMMNASWLANHKSGAETTLTVAPCKEVVLPSLDLTMPGLLTTSSVSHFISVAVRAAFRGGWKGTPLETALMKLQCDILRETNQPLPQTGSCSSVQ